jgi:iron(III)-enterobactin esterase
VRRLAPLLATVAACGGGDGGAAVVDAAPPDAAVPFEPASGTTTVLTKTVMVGERRMILFVPAFAYDPAAATFLVVNDGQDVGALGLAVTLDDLWRRELLGPMVVVALPVQPGGNRLHDYGTAERDVSIPCDTGQQLLGTRAGEYGLWVIGQALPAAAREVGLAGAPARAGLLGASLGGLSAFSLAWDHPEVFSFAGAMSGSFWWRTVAGTVEERQRTRIMHAIVARSQPRPGFRAWLQAGTRDETDDRDGDGVIDAIDDTLDLIAALRALGYEEGPDLTYRQVEGGIHGYPTWSAVLPEFLLWAAAR